MRSLVTGGAGFIGSHVSRHCLDLGHEVIVFDDLSGGSEHNIPRGAHLQVGSVADAVAVARLFSTYEFDNVYHLAAYAAEGLSHFIRRFNYTNNVIGSINLVNEAVKHEVRRFVFTSSIAVYGAGQVPMAEDETPQPQDPYGIAKYAVELDLRAAHEMFGIDVVIFRPHNVYGEHQNIGDPYRNVIGIFMNRVMQGLPLTIFGDGLQTRAFSHIDDVAPVIARSVEVPEAQNQTFNVGADVPCTVLDIARLVSRAFGVEPKIQFLPARHEVVHAFASHDKARRILGSEPQVSLEDGICRMAAWARKIGPQRTAAFAGVEIGKNMPASWRESVISNGERGAPS